MLCYFIDVYVTSHVLYNISIQFYGGWLYGSLVTFTCSDP